MCEDIDETFEDEGGYYAPYEFESGHPQPDILCAISIHIDDLFSELNCEPYKKWEIYEAIINNCGCIGAYQEICVRCDRPRILSFDDGQLLHGEGSPAIQYADGYGFYAYHGVIIPEKYGKVHPQQWEEKWLLEETDVELRQILIQELGCDKSCE